MIINQIIPEQFRKQIHRELLNIPTYNKLQRKLEQCIINKDEYKASCVRRQMLELQRKVWEEFDRTRVVERKQISSLAKDLNAEDLAEVTINLHIISLLIDQIESSVMEIDQVLNRNFYGYRVEHFDKILELGKESKNMRTEVICHGMSEEQEILYSDYSDSIRQYLRMRVKSYIKKLFGMKKNEKSK